MPLPLNPGTLAGLSKLPLAKLGNAAIIGGLEAYKVRGEIREGHNAFRAVGGALFSGAVQLLFPSILAQAALQSLPLAFAAGAGLVRGTRRFNESLRLARTPFSHRFEHSDVSYRMQSLGLQQINQAWNVAGMGAEASMLAQRYSRR